jgi:hypothetical protein
MRKPRTQTGYKEIVRAPLGGWGVGVCQKSDNGFKTHALAWAGRPRSRYSHVSDTRLGRGRGRLRRAEAHAVEADFLDETPVVGPGHVVWP